MDNDEGMEVDTTDGTTDVSFNLKFVPKAITELSGGQKALLGLALTFALSTFKQCPLYILDEVGHIRTHTPPSTLNAQHSTH